MTFLFNFKSVKMECTRHVLENIAPKAREKPAIRSQARAVQIYGNAVMLLKPLSIPRKITLRYVSMQPMIIKLFKCGLDILIYRWFLNLMLTIRKLMARTIPRTEQLARIKYTVRLT